MSESLMHDAEGLTGEGVLPRRVPKSRGGSSGDQQSSRFSPASLCLYGINATDHLTSAMQQQKASGASFFIFPLCSGDNEALQKSCVSPLAALCSMCRSSMDSQRQLLEVLSHTSSWGMNACGVVTETSWLGPLAARRIESQLRVGVFLGLHAVIVPLPSLDEGDTESSAAFAEAVDILSKHLKQPQSTNIWVCCDASCTVDREIFSRLRTAILWGAEGPPSAKQASHCALRSALLRVMPFLYFEKSFGAFACEWLGESVAAFTLPAVGRLKQALKVSVDGKTLHLPSDVIPLHESYWATSHPVFLSLGAFIVELLRRRAAPVFSTEGFFEAYHLMNLLYEVHVMDQRRDYFREQEDVLRLPLQPLGHMLPSGVYEVFEEDRTKYQQYHAAMNNYFSEWLGCYDSRSHEKLCAQSSSPVVGTTGVGSGVTTAYVVILGAGRGPLITECLCAATGAGVRVHLFVVEKNPEALEFVKLRVSADPQWREWVNYSGHVIETIHADGRAVWSGRDDELNAELPPFWGLCDLVVSELLGSFGDNELCPECLDGFHENLLSYQRSTGIPENPYLTSIPQEYTTWVAPLHSAKTEESVTFAAASGLTTPQPGCHDRHAALYHSMFVTNVCRGVSLCPPQPCWTFRHFTEAGEEKERDVVLKFPLPGGGRCSGFICFFSAVLYSSSFNNGAGDAMALPRASVGLLSTVQYGRTIALFSWFPAFLAMEPRDIMEVRNGDELHLHLRRCVNLKLGRVWYSYDVSLFREEQSGEKALRYSTKIINENGWADSVSMVSR
uniref:Putative methyltransferase n=1 Tax=Trypanosoma congolense (strain IL3000) TaxID=1068625 RepID=G0UV76_TRYCI|nr:putative methyltransferase [Trypanosoma congolense IL3000]